MLNKLVFSFCVACVFLGGVLLFAAAMIGSATALTSLGVPDAPAFLALPVLLVFVLGGVIGFRATDE